MIDAALDADAGRLSVPDLEARLLGLDEGSAAMRLGSLVHRVLAGELGPGVVQHEGFTLSAETVERLHGMAAEYPGAKREQPIELRIEAEEGEFLIKGIADLVTPWQVIDWKTSTAQVSDRTTARWRRSAQWRTYLLATGLNQFEYHYVQLAETRGMKGLYTVKAHDSKVFESNANTASELYELALRAHHTLDLLCPDAYAAYQAARAV